MSTDKTDGKVFKDFDCYEIIKESIHLSIKEVYEKEPSIEAEIVRLYFAYRMCNSLSDIGTLVKKVYKNLQDNPGYCDDCEFLHSWAPSISPEYEHSPSDIKKEFYETISKLAEKLSDKGENSEVEEVEEEE